MITGRTVTIKVRCSGALHRIRWTPPGKTPASIEKARHIQLLDHDTSELEAWEAAVALAGDDVASACRCHEVLQDWENLLVCSLSFDQAELYNKLPVSLRSPALVVRYKLNGIRALNNTSKKESK